MASESTINAEKRRFSGWGFVRGGGVHRVREERGENNRSKGGKRRAHHQGGKPGQMQNHQDANIMRETLSHQTSIPLCREELIRMRAKAIRRGVWFRTLTRSERAQVDLTIRVVQKVRSFLLARVLASLIKKLLEAMESMVVRMMRVVGSSLAEKFSQIAQNWGNASATRWAKDPSYIQYLTITHINTPTMLKL